MAQKGFKQSVADNFISSAEEPQQQQDGFTIPKGYILAKEPKTARMQVLIRPTTKEALKAEAAALGLSTNDLVNRIIEDYLDRKG